MLDIWSRLLERPKMTKSDALLITQFFCGKVACYKYQKELNGLNEIDFEHVFKAKFDTALVETVQRSNTFLKKIPISTLSATIVSEWERLWLNDINMSQKIFQISELSLVINYNNVAQSFWGNGIKLFYDSFIKNLNDKI